MGFGVCRACCVPLKPLTMIAPKCQCTGDSPGILWHSYLVTRHQCLTTSITSLIPWRIGQRLTHKNTTSRPFVSTVEHFTDPLWIFMDSQAFSAIGSGAPEKKGKPLKTTISVESTRVFVTWWNWLVLIGSYKFLGPRFSIPPPNWCLFRRWGFFFQGGDL